MAVTFQQAQRVGCTLLKALLRFAFMVANNLVAIPSYVLYLIVLQPLRVLDTQSCSGSSTVCLTLPRGDEELAMGECPPSAGASAAPGPRHIAWVVEWGDDVKAVSEDEAMVLVNHQATGDVCTLMMCLQDKGTVVRQMMWLMDHIFKYTNFGIVSLIHGDFFIRQGKAHRDQQLVLLQEHLEKYYRSRNRKWIVLFPEGGFLRKRRETSQAFAKKNNLPFLKHVTLPRLGATQVILKTLVAPQENGTPAGRDAVIKESKSKGLQWVIDTTIAYPKGEPIDIQTWILGYRQPTVTHVHYRGSKSLLWLNHSLCDRPVALQLPHIRPRCAPSSLASLHHLALLTSGYFLAECCDVVDTFRVLIVSDHILIRSGSVVEKNTTTTPCMLVKLRVLTWKHELLPICLLHGNQNITLTEQPECLALPAWSTAAYFADHKSVMVPQANPFPSGGDGGLAWLQALCSVVAGKSTACRLLPGMKESPLRGMEYFEGVGRNLARALALVSLRVLPHMLHHEFEARQSDGVGTRSKFPLLKLKPRTVKYNFLFSASAVDGPSFPVSHSSVSFGTEVTVTDSEAVPDFGESREIPAEGRGAAAVRLGGRMPALTLPQGAGPQALWRGCWAGGKKLFSLLNLKEKC
ncbi:Acyl-CoA:lysophosphatidylglycerol acyltransferase 1 [Aix galericulata]|nr:Acyl-CoA:lysophosphatidylglycerol acyltransferase 1 [Aix galericulata]